VNRVRLALAILLISVTSAAAEPATVRSTVNLRASPGTDGAIVARIPIGSRVEMTNCREWCAIAWQNKKGFVIATSLDRGGADPVIRKTARRDPFAPDPSTGNVPLSPGRYEAPERYYGPYFWSYGPTIGPYKSFSGLGFRGRW
jgi:hypothetical protein